MKVSSNVFALLLSASLACAQTGTAEQPAKPAGQPKAASSSAKKPGAKSSPAAATATKSGKASTTAKSAAAKPAAASATPAKTVKPAPRSATSTHSAPAAPKAAPAHPASTPFARKPAPASAPAMKPELKPAAPESSKPAATVPTAPVAPAAAPPAAVQMAKPYSSTGKRDPFLSPIQVATTGSGGCSGGKRCLMINQITLRGIVKSVNGWIAVVENSAQKTYFLRENDPVLNGFVSRITGETVVFKESVVDTLGHQSQRDVIKHVSAPVV